MKTRNILILLGIISLILVTGITGICIVNNSTSETAVNKKIEKQENHELSNFYSRGSYLTLNQYKYDGYEIIIFIETVKNIMQDVENPEFIKPKVYLRLLDSKNNYVDYDCLNPIISNEKIFFKSKETPIGIITMDGMFVDKQGQPWNKQYAENYQTIIRGTLSIIKDGEIKYSHLQDFEYWDGTGD